MRTISTLELEALWGTFQWAEVSHDLIRTRMNAKELDRKRFGIPDAPSSHHQTCQCSLKEENSTKSVSGLCELFSRTAYVLSTVPSTLGNTRPACTEPCFLVMLGRGWEMPQCAPYPRLCNLVLHMGIRTPNTKLRREKFSPEPEWFYLWGRKGPMGTRWSFNASSGKLGALMYVILYG